MNSVTPTYDSTEDTKQHINMVRGYLIALVDNLEERAVVHDASKLESPEKKMYDLFTPLLRELTYGSNEYKDCLAKMGPALIHHYAENSHHPEHFPEAQSDDADLLEAFLSGSGSVVPINVQIVLQRHIAALRSRVNGMTLLDLIEMLADWKAAGQRHADGNLTASLQYNKERFKMSEQLAQIFENTALEMDW